MSNPPDIAAAWDELRRARARAVRRLKVGGVPRAAWEADRRVDRKLLLVRITGHARWAIAEALSAMAEALEAFDAATAGKLVDFDREARP